MKRVVAAIGVSLVTVLLSTSAIAAKGGLRGVLAKPTAAATYDGKIRKAIAHVIKANLHVDAEPDRIQTRSFFKPTQGDFYTQLYGKTISGDFKVTGKTVTVFGLKMASPEPYNGP